MSAKLPTSKQALYRKYTLSEFTIYVTVKRMHFNVINYNGLCENYTSAEEQNTHQEKATSLTFKSNSFEYQPFFLADMLLITTEVSLL